jgi:hypothetical protein
MKIQGKCSFVGKSSAKISDYSYGHLAVIKQNVCTAWGKIYPTVWNQIFTA